MNIYNKKQNVELNEEEKFNKKYMDEYKKERNK